MSRISKKKILVDKSINDFLNTQAYTKRITEDVPCEYGRDLPIGIFRPAIGTSNRHCNFFSLLTCSSSYPFPFFFLTSLSSSYSLRCAFVRGKEVSEPLQLDLP